MDYDLRDLERRVAEAPDDTGLRAQLYRAITRAGRIPDFPPPDRKPMLVLAELAVDPDEEGKRRSWYAGGQLAALRYYLPEASFEFVADWEEQDYQGDVYALVKVTKSSEPHPVYFIWRDSFGSCGGCDSLEDADGFDYIKSSLAEGNTRQFWTIQEAVEYLKTTQDYWWEKGRSYLIPEIEKVLAKV